MTPQCPVEQRFLVIISQGGVIIIINAVHKRVRVVGWQADEGQDVAIVWIDGNGCSRVVTKCRFGHRLHAGINRQVKIVPGDWRGTVQYADDASLGSDFNLLKPYLAVQQFFIGLLNAVFTDMGGAAVVGAVESLERFFIDTTDIAECMYCLWAQRIMSRQASRNINSREAMTVNRKTCHLFIV